MKSSKIVLAILATLSLSGCNSWNSCGKKTCHPKPHHKVYRYSSNYHNQRVTPNIYAPRSTYQNSSFRAVEGCNNRFSPYYPQRENAYPIVYDNAPVQFPNLQNYNLPEHSSQPYNTQPKYYPAYKQVDYNRPNEFSENYHDQYNQNFSHNGYINEQDDHYRFESRNSPYENPQHDFYSRDDDEYSMNDEDDNLNNYQGQWNHEQDRDERSMRHLGNFHGYFDHFDDSNRYNFALREHPNHVGYSDVYSDQQDDDDDDEEDDEDNFQNHRYGNRNSIYATTNQDDDNEEREHYHYRPVNSAGNRYNNDLNDHSQNDDQLEFVDHYYRDHLKNQLAERNEREERAHFNFSGNNLHHTHDNEYDDEIDSRY